MACYRVAGRDNKALNIRTRKPKDLEQQDQSAEYKVKYNKSERHLGDIWVLYLGPNTTN